MRLPFCWEVASSNTRDIHDRDPCRAKQTELSEREERHQGDGPPCIFFQVVLNNKTPLILYMSLHVGPSRENVLQPVSFFLFCFFERTAAAPRTLTWNSPPLVSSLVAWNRVTTWLAAWKSAMVRLYNLKELTIVRWLIFRQPIMRWLLFRQPVIQQLVVICCQDIVVMETKPACSVGALFFFPSPWIMHFSAPLYGYTHLLFLLSIEITLPDCRHLWALICKRGRTALACKCGWAGVISVKPKFIAAHLQKVIIAW